LPTLIPAHHAGTNSQHPYTVFLLLGAGTLVNVHELHPTGYVSLGAFGDAIKLAG